MNLEKFKQLSLKGKIQWLVQYYGVLACVVIVAIVVIVIFFKSVFFSEPISDICVLILDDGVTVEDTDLVREDLEQLTGKSVEVVSYTAINPYGRDAFAVKLSSDQLDIVIAPSEETVQMMQTGYLKEEQKIEQSELHLGIPQSARTGEAYELAIEYFKNDFGK